MANTNRIRLPAKQVRVRTVTTKETFFLFLDNLAFSRPTESFVLVIFEDLEWQSKTDDIFKA